MKRLASVFVPGLLAISITPSLPASWPPARSPVIPQADGYIAIPNAAIPPLRTRTYRAIYDATLGADRPSQILPALNMAVAEVYAFWVACVALADVQFSIAIHY